MSKRTRGKGEGSIYRRSDGRWVGQIEAGRDPMTGRRRYHRVVRKYKADVIEALGEMQAQVREGIVPDRTKTVKTYLEWWLDTVIAGKVRNKAISEKTAANYRLNVAKYIVPFTISGVRLGELSTIHVTAWMTGLGDHGMSANTRIHAKAVLSMGLNYATGARLISSNPALHAEAPKLEVKIDDRLTTEEAHATLETARSDRLFALAHLALVYGLRIGELLNLRWDDVTGEEMKVVKSKTRNGLRTLPLLPEAQTILAAHRTAQAKERLAARSWVDSGYVFVGRHGMPLSQPYVREWFSDMLARAGVAHLCAKCGTDGKCSSNVRRFHMARHTAGTLLLEAGVALEVVSKILGHSNPAFTAKVYARVRSDMMRKGLTLAHGSDAKTA